MGYQNSKTFLLTILPVFFKNRDLSNYNLFCFIDPLDGSKNIDINGVVGSIYTIVRYDPCKDETGTIIEAGYVTYGAKTLLVIGNDSSNNSLNIFELNQNHIWVKYSTINSFKTRKHERHFKFCKEELVSHYPNGKLLPYRSGGDRYMGWVWSTLYSWIGISCIC